MGTVLENNPLHLDFGPEDQTLHHDAEPSTQGERIDSFVKKYIFSTDHKMIAKQFLITGIIWGFIGGLFSTLFRLQLAWPGESFAILNLILGDWAPNGILAPEFYYALVTMHGTIMVFFVLTAGLSGTFSNLLIPLQLGARDMASGFMNMLSYWFFFLSSVIMFSSLFISTGPASGGWVIYPPLSALPQAIPGSGLGMTLWLISMAIFIASSLIGSLNYITTIINFRTKGMKFTRMPLTIWSFLFTAAIGTLSFPVLLAGALLLIFDRSFGTAFYLNEIYIEGAPLVDRVGGSPILFQHLFWFLGHPEVYIVLLPALGITSEVISTNSRKPIFGYKAMILSMAAIMFLSFVVWAHHMFVSGMNPFLGTAFMLLTLIIAIPSAVKVFNYLTTLWRGNLRFTTGMLFSVGMVSLFIGGGLTGIFLANSAIDILFHDTYFVVAHFHTVMGAASMFGMFAGVYHWFPKMFGKMMDKRLGYIHFWLTIISVFGVFGTMHFIGVAGVPRRYYANTTFAMFDKFQDMNVIITYFAIIGFLAQFVFLINFVYSIFWGAKADRNPWNSTTLEWTTESALPGHGNWEGDLPTVYRWPYDFSRPDFEDDDFIPQNVPSSDVNWKDGAPSLPEH